MARPSEVRSASITDVIHELDRLAIDTMADWKVPGAALAVVQDGKVALAKGYASGI
jgi:CubicO group peptidase (beta-lactamase class C family)